jgi:hypothetical protein
MTAEEEEQRAKQAADGLSDFMSRLTQALEKQQREQQEPEE